MYNFVPDETDIITCPYCGSEYLFSEVFYPQCVFEKPLCINRDEHHKIISYTGRKSDNEETYTCDYCLKKFNITLIKHTESNKIPGYDIFDTASTKTYVR